VGRIQVETGALRAAAGVFAVSGLAMRDAEGEIRAAGSVGLGSFGGELPGAAFDGMIGRALSAMSSIADAADQLATNTAAAAEGYYLTDIGAIPSGLRIAHGAEMGSP
jgi:uncharacterized protein YukE